MDSHPGIADDGATIEVPTAAGVLRELQAAFELPNLVLSSGTLARQPRGCGEKVLVLPGFGASDASTALLRAYLRLLGHDARGWGLGRNDGDADKLLPRVLALVESLARARSAPVPLVGWSFGGVLAREAARERPDLIRLVVTLGSPIVGGPKYTAAAETYRRRGFDLDEIERRIDERNRMPLSTPVLAIYSRRDAVVAWQACIDRYNASVEHVEVDATHVGLGISASVWALVAARLARPAREAA